MGDVGIDGGVQGGGGHLEVYLTVGGLGGGGEGPARIFPN